MDGGDVVLIKTAYNLDLAGKLGVYYDDYEFFWVPELKLSVSRRLVVDFQIIKRNTKDKNSFKNGDKIKAIYPPDDNKSLIGKRGYVKKVGSVNVLVSFNGSMEWWCEPFTLELEKKQLEFEF